MVGIQEILVLALVWLVPVVVLLYLLRLATRFVQAFEKLAESYARKADRPDVA